MARRKHATIGGYKLQALEFTPPQVRVIKKGLVFFAESLQRSHVNASNLSLARFGYVTVLNKVTRMLTESVTVSFDYNELVIISGCLDMVLIDASFMADPVDFGIAVQLNGRVKDQIANAPRPVKKPYPKVRHERC